MPDTNTAKRQRVTEALQDPACQPLSTRVLARQCGVSHDMVHRMRRELSSDDGATGRRHQAEAHGATTVLTGEVLVGAGCSIALAQRVLTRLAAMSTSERRRVEGVLVEVLLLI